MNNSPFDLFRRNLKPMMVFLTGLALFAFVVLPVLDTYMRAGISTGGDGVVARFHGTDLTRSRVEYFTRNHQSTVRFLAELANQTISRGGYPRTAGFQYDDQNDRIQAIGINESPSAEGTIRTFMLASEASRAGFDLDDSTLQLWLEQFTDGMISSNDIDAMLMGSTQNQMGRPHLYEQLRNHLLANVYLTRGYAALYMGDSPMSGSLLTPEEQWTNFLKLNRTAVATTYGVQVEDFLDQTNKNPSETEITATYEEGKDVDFNDQSPAPAFHRRYSASFEYLVGYDQNFLDEEVAKLSEEEIRAEYDRRLKGGDFQVPDSAAADMLKAAEEAQQNIDRAQAGETESEAGPEASDKTDEASDKTDEASDKTDEASDKTDEAKDESKGADPSASANEEAKPADEESETPSPAVEDSSAAEPESDETESDDGESEQESSADQSSLMHSDVRLVALQESDDKDAQPADADQDEKADSQGDANKVEEKAAEKTDTDPGDAEKPAPAAKKADPAASTDDKPESSEDSKTTATEAESAADDTTPAKEAEPKVESFEDVCDEIAQDMAGPAARARMDAVITEVNSKMLLYFKERAIHESYVSIGQAGDPPVKPDLAKLGAELGLTHEVIPPYTEVTIAEEPIANSFDVGTQFGQRGPSFSVIMFGFANAQTQLPRQELFVPVRTADDPGGKIYVSWKIDETEAYTPTLAKARDEVIRAIQRKEARKLAREAAEAIAKEVNGASDKSLQDIVPKEKQGNIIQAGSAPSAPFKWMDMIPSVGVTIGNVPELNSVGNEFMKTVFTTDPGKCAVAMNDPENVCYVIQPTKIEPLLDDLRLQFKQPINRMMATFVGNDAHAILSGFYKSVDEQAGFVDFESEQ